MPVTLSHLSALAGLPFDQVIDVRSPAEFAEDHIPGAINLPALSNEERARVGTIYTQVNPFEARKIGAALVARNAARALETTLADRPKGYRPLVYCWRGGQRSGSFSIILRQIGWQSETIDGGYRAFRRLVQKALYDAPWPAPVVVLEGNTGLAKTALLPRIAAEGVQVIDLEGLANHRGSIFGPMPGGQPAQKMFETRLAMAAAALDPAQPVLVEGESSKIGRINLPPALWDAMKAAPRIELTAPLTARAGYISRSYAEITQDPAQLRETLLRLAPLHPRDRVEDWLTMGQSRDWPALAASLMQHHYDPRYARQRGPFADRIAARIDLPDLAGATLDQTARCVAAMIGQISAA
ncbi:tRNA 2-selenouridine(34) synthase MnmH [Actibacterium sp. XHP0104]|uniref:tRNA 2-selenouridine(34) synthase MnmH n=1 Tax=Actibacterium sp. XHP0104 TaxID=2984335 RepID=UPI0039949477